MSLFEFEYQNALTYIREYPIQTKPNFNIYPTISHEMKEHLYYILNYGSREAKYPHAIHLNPINAFLVLYTYNGQGQLTYHNNTYILKAGTIFFIDCHSEFYLEVFQSSNWSYEWFYLNGNSISYLFQEYFINNDPVYYCKRPSTLHDNFVQLMDYIKQKVTNPLISSMLIDTLLTNLVFEKSTLNRNEQIPQYIQNIKKLFDENYSEDYNLDKLSAQFKVSKYTLSRDFTKYIKISPIEYLINQRITVAKKLLCESDLTINEISLHIGIDNPTHFINLFKKRVGLTPLQFRKQMPKELTILKH